MADDSALVFVAPSDSVETIIQKIRGTGAASVELLVPDGTPALQALGGFARLRQSLDLDNVSLLVISSDEKTLSAAQLNQLETVGVEGARVLPAAPAGNGERAAARSRATVPLDERDAEFLDALDQLAPADRYAGEEDADLYAALDDLSDTTQPGTAAGRGPRADDEFAAALDDWAAVDSSGTRADDWKSEPERATTVRRRRVRPEDLDVSDELGRQRGARRTATSRARSATRAAEHAAPRGRRAGATPAFDREEAEEHAPPRRGLGLLIPLLLLLLIAASAVFWYTRNHVTIAVAPPTTTASQRDFQSEVIPLTGGTDKSPSAVQATPIDAAAEFQVQGQVTSETLSPAGTAKGTVTVINRIEQPIPLPEGTQFIAVKEGGQEVRFKLDQPATAPPAATTSSLTGSSTTFGTVDVAVTALSPGSASNVGENAIKQILIPGQEPIATDTGNFVLRNAPIGGGNEQPVRVVTEADVLARLQEALTGLYNDGFQKLQAQIDGTREVDPVSIAPRPEALGEPQNYEIDVAPPVGAQVEANNPSFTVTVRTHFSALAMPRGQLLGQQLNTVLPEHFASACKAGERTGIDYTDYRWDGQKLVVDGTITCTPSVGLAPETASRVKRAVSGKPRAVAEQSLQALQREGLIGSYVLPPNKDQFPSLDFLLTVVEAQPGQPQPTSTP